jgi:drug/metabolite transporter (DMT)-like permease
MRRFWVVLNTRSKGWIATGVVLVFVGLVLLYSPPIFGVDPRTLGGACVGAGFGLAVGSLRGLREAKQPPSN